MFPRSNWREANLGQFVEIGQGQAWNGFGPIPVSMAIPNLRTSPYLVGGLEHEFYFSIYWEFHHPN